MNVLETVDGHTGEVTNICMGSDMVYTSSIDNSVRCWVFVKFKLNFILKFLQQKESANKEEIRNQNSISLEGKQYATNNNHKMELWDMKVIPKFTNY